jgi:hypothetical protein
MSQQLLRRAWDALDTFKQAYPENWHEDDQQVLDDLIKADLGLAGVKREWEGLTDDEIIDVIHPLVMADMPDQATDYEIARAIEAKLKEKNT